MYDTHKQDKMKRFKVIKSPTLELLEEIVNIHLVEGWEVVGSIHTLGSCTNKLVTYTQGLIKPLPLAEAKQRNIDICFQDMWMKICFLIIYTAISIFFEHNVFESLPGRLVWYAVVGYAAAVLIKLIVKDYHTLKRLEKSQ